MEGWATIRVAGQTDWKKLWVVVSSGKEGAIGRPGSAEGDSMSVTASRRKRMSQLFTRDHSPPVLAAPGKATISMFLSQKPKDKKRPILTLSNVTQAFAVYPERPELINHSTLMKVEGLMGDEDTAGAMRSREAWLLMMPTIEAGSNQTEEMLKWVIGQ